MSQNQLLPDDPLLPVPPLLAPGPEYQTPARQFQGIPGIEVTAGGRLWATWYTGGVNEGPENFVVLVTSADRGQTWSEPVLVIDPPGAHVRAYDPAIWTDPLGRLWLFWSQCLSPKDGQISDGVNGVWGLYTEDPESAAPTWSAPLRLAPGVMMNKPFVLSTGEWGYPTAVWNDLIVKSPDGVREHCRSNLTVSTDQGRTYERRGGADVPRRCFDEHHIVELRDGRLWCLVRTNYGIGQSFSCDRGRTWTPGEDSGIGGPNTRFFIRRLQSGRLLLVNHWFTDEEKASRSRQPDAWLPRRRLAAWLSDDEGTSWHGGLMLDERPAVSYPDGVQDHEGTIWIIYDHERHSAGDILFARFREEDIEAGRCVSAVAVLRCLINRTGGVRAAQA
jgi:hypothetical protein